MARKNLVKSYSNYVLRKKHQNINSGSIYERDITTIGGLNKFSPGQIPMYQSSNFIITYNNTEAPSKDYLTNEFKEWNLSTIINENSEENTNEDTTKIVIKQNFYKLRDFAYFGSCVELIRASLTDIVNKFPGELCPLENYDGTSVEIDWEENRLKVLDNPFNIDLYTSAMDQDKIDNPLKYMCNGGYKNYCIFSDGNYGEPFDNFSVEYNNNKCGVIATITLGKKDDEDNNCTISAYKDESTKGNIIYLTDKENLHIRPIKKFYDEFFYKLDSFEKVLMNKDTNPEYTATFEVLSENSYGYDRELKQFTFPKKNDYNIDVYGPAYESYLKELYFYAQEYDEIFCDNLYRSMTHEAIKNFDWSFKRRFTDEEEEQYIDGGNKIMKAIRLFGREFDEIKFEIDSIKDFHNIEYGNNSLLPDYFLSDVLRNDGWNVINVYPYNNDLKQITKLFNEKNEIFIKPYPSRKDYTIVDANNHFLKMLKLNSKSILRKKGTIEGIESLLALFGLKSKRMRKKEGDSYDYEIKEYIVKTNPIVDKYESKYNKPKLDWNNSTKNIAYDTDNFRNNIYEPYQGLPVRGYIKFNKYKKSDYKLHNIDEFSPRLLYKILSNEEPEIYGYSDGNVYLYPYFSNNKIIDGNPYYQMNGGWMRKTHQFTYKNEMLVNEQNSYTETYRNIRNVENIDELLDITLQSLKDNDIVKVNNTAEDYAVICGLKYHIYIDKENNPYIKVYVFNHKVTLGIKTFDNIFTVSDINTEKKYNLNTCENNTEIRIYVQNANNEENNEENRKIIAKGSYYEIKEDEVQIYLDSANEEKTKFYQIKNRLFKNNINNDGWCEINEEKNKDIFGHLNTIVNKVKGNNPHTGNLNYDNGYEYISYYIELFKYALDNNLFDQNCYDDISEIVDLRDSGFTNIKDEENIYSYIIYEDNKVQKFMFHPLTDKDGNIIRDSNGKIKKEYDNPYSGESDNVKIDIVDGITDQIINTKRVDIIFNCEIDEENKYFYKYLDEVVMNYLEQVYPSDLITKVKYNKIEIEYELSASTCEIGACDTEPCKNIQGRHRTNYPDKEGEWSEWEGLTEGVDFTITTSKIDKNYGDKSKEIPIEVYGKEKYDGKNGSYTVTQLGGCTDGNEYIHTLSASTCEIGACDTEPCKNISGKTELLKGNGDIEVVEDWHPINPSDGYTLHPNSTIKPNYTDREINYNVTVSGTNKYSDADSITYTITQLGGCKDNETYELRTNNIDDVESCFTGTSWTDKVKVSACTITNLDGKKTENCEEITNTDYDFQKKPNIKVNQTTSRVNIPYTVEYKGSDSNYKGKTASGDITQEKGPCCIEGYNYGYSGTTLSFDVSQMGRCDKTPSVSNVKASNVEYKDDNCEVSYETVNIPVGSYTVTSDPSGANETSSSRTVKVTVTTNGSYGNLTATASTTQAAGPCTDVVTYKYHIEPYAIGIISCYKGQPKIDKACLWKTKYINGVAENNDYRGTMVTDSFNEIKIIGEIPTFTVNQTEKKIKKKYYIESTNESYIYQDGGDKATGIITQDAGPCCIPGYDFSNSKLDVRCANEIGACDEHINLLEVILLNTIKTDDMCVSGYTAYTLEADDYEYSPHEVPINQTNTKIEIKIKVWIKEEKEEIYGKKETEITIHQNPGPCHNNDYHAIKCVNLEADCNDDITYNNEYYYEISGGTVTKYGDEYKPNDDWKLIRYGKDFTISAITDNGEHVDVGVYPNYSGKLRKYKCHTFGLDKFNNALIYDYNGNIHTTEESKLDTEITEPHFIITQETCEMKLTFDASIGNCDTKPTISNVKLNGKEYNNYKLVDWNPKGKNYGINDRNISVTVETTDFDKNTKSTRNDIVQSGGCEPNLELDSVYIYQGKFALESAVNVSSNTFINGDKSLGNGASSGINNDINITNGSYFKFTIPKNMYDISHDEGSIYLQFRTDGYRYKQYIIQSEGTIICNNKLLGNLEDGFIFDEKYGIEYFEVSVKPTQIGSKGDVTIKLNQNGKYYNILLKFNYE